MERIGILGAGTWGVALARMLCIKGHDVTVWSALPEEIESLSKTRQHPNLPSSNIPDDGKGNEDRGVCGPFRLYPFNIENGSPLY